MSQPQPLPTTNPQASLADKIVQDVVADLVPVVETMAITAYPGLALPVIKQLWEALFGWIAGMFGKAAGLATGYVVIDSQKYFALKSAADALTKLNEAKKTGDTHAIQDASNAVDQAIAPILHYVGDVRPK